MSSDYQDEDFVLKLGSHLTWHELENIENSILKREREILRVRGVNYDKLPIYFVSIRNLFGYILYKLDDVEESKDVFKEVLSKDPDNLNAVKNLIEIYTDLGKSADANVYKKRLEMIIKHIKNSMVVRSLCERAHAVRHFQQDCREFTYMPYLRQALELGAYVRLPERCEWLFDYSLALFRKDFQLLLAHATSEEKEPNFVEAIHSFYDVTQVETGSTVYQALSWVFMGILLRHDDSRSLKSCFPNNSELHNMESIDCIERGLSLAPENQIVTRRVASEFSRVGRNEEAAKLFKKSLAKEKSWFAYRHQGLMYLRMYEAKKDQELLVNAETSFKCAIEMKDVHADHSDLGYVYFLRGPSHWDKALKKFHCAEKNTNNDNFDTTETQRRWAECLRACGEDESAKIHLQHADDIRKQLKTMIDKIKKVDLNHGTNCQGTECTRYHSEYCGDHREGFVNIKIAQDMPYKTRFLINQEYTRQPFEYDFFLSFCHIDHKWAVALLKKLEHDLNLVGCLRYRDYRLGVSKVDNIVNAIQTSYKTIIIMSPDSLKDNLCKVEIDHAAFENSSRQCIIPVTLRPCKTPQQIRQLCGIKCERGQIHEHDWARLVKELRKNTQGLEETSL